MLVWQVHESFTNKEEFEIIKNYQMTNDLSIFFNAIGNLKKASPAMLRSIAAIHERKVIIPQYKRASGRKHNYERDISIAFKVHQQYKTIGHFKKRFGRYEKNRPDEVVDGAATTVGKKVHLSEAAVYNIYKSIAERVTDMDNPNAPKILRHSLVTEDMGVDELFLRKLILFMISERLFSCQHIENLPVKSD